MFDLFTGLWKLANDDSDSPVTHLLSDILLYMQAMSKVPPEPTLPDMISLLETLDMYVKTGKEEETAEAENSLARTAMKEASARLSGLVTQDSTDKLMDVLRKSHIDPAAAKEHFAKCFPKAPPQTMLDLSKMYNAVAAIVTSGIALVLDVDKIEVSTAALAAQSRQFGLASSFDVALVAKVSPELAKQMASFIQNFSESLTGLVNKDSSFATELQAMIDNIDKYRHGSSRRCQSILQQFISLLDNSFLVIQSISQFVFASCRPLIGHCETWKLDEVKWMFDESHPDYQAAETTLKSFPDLRASWQIRWKELQQIAAVAQSHQASLKAFTSDIAKARSDAALIVGCAILTQIVLKQSQYRNQGVLPATIKAALKQAASMGLSLGDFPTKLRTFVEGLNKGIGSAPLVQEGINSDQTSKGSTGSAAEKRGHEDEPADRKAKKEKKADKKEKDRAEVEVWALFTSVPIVKKL